MVVKIVQGEETNEEKTMTDSGNTESEGAETQKAGPKEAVSGDDEEKAGPKESASSDPVKENGSEHTGVEDDSSAKNPEETREKRHAREQEELEKLQEKMEEVSRLLSQERRKQRKEKLDLLRKRCAGWRKAAAGFLKTPKGRLILAVCVVVFLVGTGVNGWMKGSLVRAGRKAFQEGDYAQAQICFKNAVDADTRNAKKHNDLGMAYLGGKSYDDAIKQFQLALNMKPESEDSYRGLGIAYLGKQKYEQAIEAFNQALDYCGIRIGEEEYDILWYRAQAEMALKDYKGAVGTYTALMKLEGDTARVRYYRGNVYACMGEKESAMEDFNAAISREGNGYELYWNIYDSMKAAGWLTQAREYLLLTEKEGYITDSGLSEVQLHRNQGMVKYICEDYKGAIRIFSADDLKKDEKSRMYLALSYEKNGNLKKAEAIYQKQLKAEDATAADYNRAARYYIRRQDSAQALKYLEAGISSFPDENLQDLYYNRVTAYEVAGEYTSAKEALKEYTSRYGSDESSKKEAAFLKDRGRKES